MKDNSALPKNVGIWIRVSSEDQAKGESPAHHLERARSYLTRSYPLAKSIFSTQSLPLQLSPNDQKLSHAAGDFRQPETRSEN